MTLVGLPGAVVVPVRMIWNHNPVIPLPGLNIRETYVDPEPEYPYGRKGLVLTRVWEMFNEDAHGMLIVDGDVAIDPADMNAMSNSISKDTSAVHVAPAKLWP